MSEGSMSYGYDILSGVLRKAVAGVYKKEPKFVGGEGKSFAGDPVLAGFPRGMLQVLEYLSSSWRTAGCGIISVVMVA